MRYRILIPFLMCLLLISSNAFAAEEAPQRWAIFPVAGYMPETSLLGALSVAYFLNPDRAPGAKPSTVTAILVATLKKQLTLNILPDLYFANDSLHLQGVIVALSWPTWYYGLGRNSLIEDEKQYHARGCIWDGGIEYAVLPRTSLGLSMRVGFEDITWEDGTAPAELYGSGGAVFSLWGFQASYDSRNAGFWPSSGIYAQFKSLWSVPALGSDFVSNEQLLDLRVYTELISGHIVALNARILHMSGEPYFRYLAFPGIRAMQERRYLDSTCVQFRAEYRYPIYKRFRGTVFMESANLASSFRTLRADQTLFSAGIGLRFALHPGEIFNARLDVAYVDGGINLEIMVSEKF